MLPALLEGQNALVVAIVASSAIMFLLMYLAHGVNPKTTTALLGTLVSLALTGLLAAVFVGVARVANVNSEEASYLQISASQVSLKASCWAGSSSGRWASSTT